MPATFLQRLVGGSGQPQALSPNDDRLWGGYSAPSLAGVNVDADTALKISTWYALVAKWGDVIGSLPLFTYLRLPDGGKEKAREVVLYRLLHDQPNLWQTSIEWRSLGMNHIFHRGNFYNEIIPDMGTGEAAMLMPLNPERVEAKLGTDGRMGYKVRLDAGGSRDIPQERMFHVRGRVTKDGVTGLAVLDAAKDALGLAMSMEQYAATSMRDNALPSGTLTHPGTLSKEARTAMREEWQSLHGGSNKHQIAILQEGMTFSGMTMTNEQMQMLEARHFSVADIARFGDMPLMMLQETEKATSWGTGIEQFQIGFVVHSVRPWCVRWEQAISRDLIRDNDLLFAEFLLDGLLRGDAKSRNEALQIMRQNGIISLDEWRSLEGMNPVGGSIGEGRWQPLNITPASPDGLSLAQRVEAAGALVRAGYDPDETLVALNLPDIRHTGAAPITLQSDDTPSPKGGPKATAQVHLLAQEAAGRLVRKETVAVAKAARKYAADDVIWRSWLGEFYEGFAGEIMRDLHIGMADARSYCEMHAKMIDQMGAGVVETFEADWTADLSRLVLAALDVDAPAVRRVTRTVERDDNKQIARVVEEEEIIGGS